MISIPEVMISTLVDYSVSLGQASRETELGVSIFCRKKQIVPLNLLSGPGEMNNYPQMTQRQNTEGKQSQQVTWPAYQRPEDGDLGMETGRNHSVTPFISEDSRDQSSTWKT